MKKIIVLVCVLFTLVSVTKAEGKVKYGILGGLNYSTITKPDQFNGENVDDMNWRLGFKAGLISDIPLGPVLSIQPSLLYSAKGFSVKEKSGSASGEINVNANYIELPLMLAFKIPFSENLKLGISAGPYVAYGVGGKSKAEGSLGSWSGGVEMDTFDDDLGMKRFDWGVGVGAALEMGRFKFFINYDHGLQPVYDVDDSDNQSFNYGFWAGLGIYL